MPVLHFVYPTAAGAGGLLTVRSDPAIDPAPWEILSITDNTGGTWFKDTRNKWYRIDTPGPVAMVNVTTDVQPPNGSILLEEWTFKQRRALP